MKTVALAALLGWSLCAPLYAQSVPACVPNTYYFCPGVGCVPPEWRCHMNGSLAGAASMPLDSSQKNTPQRRKACAAEWKANKAVSYAGKPTKSQFDKSCNAAPANPPASQAQAQPVTQ